MIRAGYRRSEAARWLTVDAYALPAAPTEPSVYGGSRVNWPLIGFIVALHLLAGYLLVALDVVHVIGKPATPTVVTLIPDLAPPPPPSAPKAKPLEAAEPTLAPPVAIVQVPAPTLLAMPAAPSLPVVAVKAAPVAAAPVAAPPKPVALDASAATIAGDPPSYPIESRRKKEQGTVVLRILIGTDGRPDEVSVAQSSGFERLDKAALNAVRKWRFKPPSRDGQPVQGLGSLSIPFELEG